MKGVTIMANEKTKADSVNLADMQAQMEAMLAEAKKAKEEAEKLLADAKASASGELTEEQKKANAKRKEYWNELVPVELFKDNHKYKDDVYVSVNGENCAIKRGERVMIKRKFDNVLANSKLQDYKTSNLIEKKSQEFAKSEF
jgi:hypothetical protein